MRKAQSEKTKSKVTSLISKLADINKNSILQDVIAALKEDHDSLRELGSILKSEDATDAEKKEAYKNFSTLLKSHSKSEEKAVYEKLCGVDDIVQEAEEGYVEHSIAESLMKNISNARNKDKWSAMVKVLAEVVEHHADEEEKEMLPKLNEHFEKPQQEQMAHQFLELREKSQTHVTDENAGILAELKEQTEQEEAVH